MEDPYQPPSAPLDPPRLASNRLWLWLLLPMGLVLLANLFVGWVIKPGAYAANFLGVLPFGLLVILVCYGFFFAQVRKVYRGGSLVFLSFAYLFGEILLCLTVWFGSCFLFVN